MKKSRIFASVAAAVLSLAAAVTGFAEGSKDLVSTEGLSGKVYSANKNGAESFDFNQKGTYVQGKAYRPFLEWKNGEKLLDMAKRSVIYAYVKEGEYVFFGSSVESTNELSMRAVYTEDDGSTDTPYKTIGNYAGSTVAVTLPVSEKDAYKPTKDSGIDWGSGIAKLANPKEYTNNRTDNVYFFQPDKITGMGLIKTIEHENLGPNINAAKPWKKYANGSLSQETITGQTIKRSHVNDEGVEETVIIEGNNEKGYVPFAFIAPRTGVYSFRFLSSAYNGGANPYGNEGLAADLQWDNTKVNGGAIAAWDICVAERDTATNTFTIQEGRVGAKVLFLSMGSHRRGVFSKLYTLTDDGFLYKFSLNGMQPFGFGLYSNKRGFIFDVYNLTGADEDRPSDATHPVYTIARPLDHSFFSTPVSGGGADVGPSPVREETDGYGNPIYDGSGAVIRSSIKHNAIPVDPVRDKTNILMFNYPDKEFVDAMTLNKKIADSASDLFTKFQPNIRYYGYGNNNAAGSDYEDFRYTDEKGNVHKWQKDEDGTVTAVTTENTDNKITEGAVPYGPYGQGGDFRFLLTPEQYNELPSKTFRIVLDFSPYELKYDTAKQNYVPVLDDKGEWKKAETVNSAAVADVTSADDARKNNKVTLTTTVHDPKDFETNKVPLRDRYNIIVWDGRDAYGNAVPKGVYDSIAQGSWQAGMAHFPLLDVEMNPNGIIIERLNQIKTAEGSKIEGETNDEYEENKFNVCYNNEGSASDPNAKWYFFRSPQSSPNAKIRYEIGDQKNAAAGVSSKPTEATGNRGAMPYYLRTEASDGDQSEGSGYGDCTAIDIWTSFQSKTVTPISIGVQADPKDYVINPAVVSFIGEKKDTKFNIWTNVPAYEKNKDNVNVSSTQIGSHTRVGYLAPTELSPEVVGNNKNYYIGQDKNGTDNYGNTISTGFRATVSDGVNDLYESGSTTNKIGISKYDRIAWGVNIPISTDGSHEGKHYTYKSMNDTAVDSYAAPVYIKVPAKKADKVEASGESPEELMISIYDLFGEDAFNEDVELGAEGDVEEIGGDVGGDIAPMGFTAVSLDTADGTFTFDAAKKIATGATDSAVIQNYTPVLVLDTENAMTDEQDGTIYRVKGVKVEELGSTDLNSISRIRLEFQYKLTGLTANPDERSASYGLIIDDLYAPSANADVSIYYRNQLSDGSYDESTNASRVGVTVINGLYQVPNDGEAKYDYNEVLTKSDAITTTIPPKATPSN